MVTMVESLPFLLPVQEEQSAPNFVATPGGTVRS